MERQFPILSSSDKKELSSLIKFSKFLIFKDEKEAEASETLETSKRAYDLISAYLGLTPYESNDPNTLSTRNKIMANYKEKNIYYHNFLVKLGYYNKETDSYYDQNIAVAKIIEARTARDNEIIFYKEGIIPIEYQKSYVGFYRESLLYYRTVLHNEGFSQYKKYWNYVNFIVVFMTMIKMITAKIDLVFDIDSFSERTVRNMFASYGLEFFTEIPMKYRKRLLKNLNAIIENKGTSKAILNIVEIFGFESIHIFKYYLIKDFERDEIGEIIGLKDSTILLKPKLKFVKVEHDETNIEKSFFDNRGRYENFDTFIEGDPYWQASEEEIATYDFNYINTKYLSVEVALDLRKISLQHAYFYNWIKNFKQKVDDQYTGGLKLCVYSYNISSEPLHIFDLLIAMNFLALKILDCPDNIIKDFGSVDFLLNNFNPEDYQKWDLTKSFEENMHDRHTHFVPSRMPGDNVNWSISKDTLGKNSTAETVVLSYKENYNYMEKFRKILTEESSYPNYRYMRNLYESKVISEINVSMFDGFSTYADYIKASNPELYTYLTSEGDYAAKLFEIISIVEGFVDSSGVLGVPLNLIEDSKVMEYLRNFIKKVINIFKAYTTQLRDFVTYFVWRDPLDDTARLREDNIFTGIIPFLECIANEKGKLEEELIIKGHFTKEDEERLEEFVEYFVRFNVEEQQIVFVDFIPAILSRMSLIDENVRGKKYLYLDETLKFLENFRASDSAAVKEDPRRITILPARNGVELQDTFRYPIQFRMSIIEESERKLKYLYLEDAIRLFNYLKDVDVLKFRDSFKKSLIIAINSDITFKESLNSLLSTGHIYIDKVGNKNYLDLSSRETKLKYFSSTVGIILRDVFTKKILTEE
jgi:hypothetical protein